MTLTFGSLFAGIGGFDLGFERAGLTCKWQVEIDPYCNKVLAKHWPHVKRHDDVRTFPPRCVEFRYTWRTLPMGPFTPDVCRDRTRDEWGVDVICGGFPCQDISSAGKRAGLAGARSGLWSEYIRIVRQLRPRFVVVENVSALLALGMGTVLSDLAESGFDAEWQMLPAAAFGLPHLRERVFIIAYAKAQRAITSPEGVPARRLSREFRGVSWREWLRGVDQPPVVGTRDGIPNYFHRNGSLGNAVVPQIAEWIGKQLIQATKDTP